MKETRYYLALDLGISSVGWAVMAKNSNEYSLDDFGVRLFDVAEDPKKGTTNNEIRREFRSKRRLNRRRKQRINAIKNFLIGSNIIEQEKLLEIFSANAFKKITSNVIYDEKKYFNPYVLRVKGLKHKLLPEELAIALIHIAKHRGYNDPFSFGEENDNNKLKEAINQANKLVKNQTVAEAILNNESFKDKINKNVLGTIHNLKSKENIVKKNNEAEGNNKISNNGSSGNYRFLFDRDQYRKELQLLLKTQSNYYPQLINKIDYLIEKIILRQRDFEEGPGPRKNTNKYESWKKSLKTFQFFKPFVECEGNCAFYPNEKKGYKSSLTFEIFRLITQLSTFTVKIFTDKTQAVTFSKILFDNIKNKNFPDKNLIKTIIINISDTITKKEFTNNQAWKEMKLNLSYLKLMNKVTPDSFNEINFFNLKDNLFNQIGLILHQNITPKKRLKVLTDFFGEKNINISEQEIKDNFLNLDSAICTSSANASEKYMQEAINAFIKGEPYNKFQANFNAKNETKKFDHNAKKLFGKIIDEDIKKNAVVYRAINESRKILMNLHQKYGFFDVINIETAREFAKSFDERSKIKKEQDFNYQRKIAIKEILKIKGIIANDTNVLRYRLWQEQKGKCIYCQDHHDILLTEFDQFYALEIDHIIPQKVMSDDSLNNKVLVCRLANQNKGKKTPLEWINNNTEHKKSYLNFCNAIKSNISEKKYDYLMTLDINDEKLSEFTSRNLNDTRWITRYISNWVEWELKNWAQIKNIEMPTKVQRINGAVTSRFRRIWLADSAWGLDKKVRDITHFHHAVDAIVLAQFISVSYVNLATDMANIINLKNKLFKKLIDYTNFETACNEVLTKWKTGNYQPHFAKRLEKLINYPGKINQTMSPLIEDFKMVIESRIPVVLEIEEKEIKIKISNKLINKKDEGILPANQEITKRVKSPKFVKVRNIKEYQEILKPLSLKGNIHYPFISYRINKKLSGTITSSQNPVNHKFEIQNKTKTKVPTTIWVDKQKQQLTNSYFKDKNNNIWEINNYYGLVVADQLSSKKENFIWLRKYKIKENIKKFEKQTILVPKTIVKYYDKKDNKELMKVFCGKTGEKIYSNLLGTALNTNLEKNKEIFHQQNYYDSISNWKKIKILNPNILGFVKNN